MNPTPDLSHVDNATSADLAAAFHRWFYIASRHATTDHVASLGVAAISQSAGESHLARMAMEHPDPHDFYRAIRCWFLGTASAILSEPYWSNSAPFHREVFSPLRFFLDGVRRNPVLTRHVLVMLLRDITPAP